MEKKTEKDEEKVVEKKNETRIVRRWELNEVNGERKEAQTSIKSST